VHPKERGVLSGEGCTLRRGVHLTERGAP